MSVKVYQVNYNLVLGDVNNVVIVVSAPDVTSAIVAVNTQLGNNANVSVSSAVGISTIDVEATAQTLQAQIATLQATITTLQPVNTASPPVTTAQ